jgi:hypothetical protein
MAGKKQRAKQVSKGERVPANKKISNMVRGDRTYVEKMISKLEAFKRGKKVYFTIENGNPNETNKRFIRVEGSLIYGDWRSFGQPPKKDKTTQATG